MGLIEELHELKNALFDFSKRNPLVNIKPDGIWWIDDVPDDKTASKIYANSNTFLREYGLETTLDVRLFIKWCPPKSKSSELYVVSPLFYYPTRISRKRRIKVEYSAESYLNKGMINPLISYYFEKWFDLKIPQDLDENQIRVFLEKNFQKENNKTAYITTTEFTDEQRWEIIVRRGIGNFNYKKSVLHADYEMLIAKPNHSISRVLGYMEPAIHGNTDIVEVDHLDRSQQLVIHDAIQNDLVIQGPPGTGKSHTIVSLISNYLAQGKKVLFVSEKRVALQVVQERLTQLGLGHLTAFFNTQKDQKKRFYKRLKNTLQYLNNTQNDPYNGSFEEVKRSPLIDLYCRLFQPNDKLNISFQELMEHLASVDLSIDELKLKGVIPSYSVWKSALPVLEFQESEVVKSFGQKLISDCGFMMLNPAVFQEKNPTVILEKRLDDLTKVLEQLEKLCKRFDLVVHVEELTRLALTASILSMVDKVQLDLLNVDSKKYRSFNNWAKKYATLKTKIKHAEKANEGWSRKPSLSEITELIDIIKSAARSDEKRKGIFRHLKRSPAKVKEAFRDFHSTISDHAKIKLLEGLQLEWRLRAEFDEVKVKLKHHFNINEPSQEIDLIFSLRTRLDRVSTNQYLTILEHNNSGELIQDLAALHPELAKANGQLKFIFAKYPIHDVLQLKRFISTFKKELSMIHHWLPELRQLFDLPQSIRQLLNENRQSVSRLTSGVVYHELMKSMRFETAFKNLSGWELGNELNKSIIDRTRQQLLGRSRLVGEWQSQYKELENLIETPAIKLKGESKQKKKDYKQVRRRIQHESHKQQQHMAIREFFSETNPDLIDLQPVWMMNPLTVSEFLPCKDDLFDVVIFDESSQIPLEDAIPSIYRAKQTIVVGDSNQMPPGSFFSSRSETLSLLDQADETLKSSILSWHYRSSNPSLITFSNRHFYDNQLLSLPPINAEKPIEFHYVANGIFDQGKNSQEALVLTQFLSKMEDQNKSVMIITFSLEQEKCIRKHLANLNIETGRLLSIRNLENVQGTQTDIVLLSIGYGKNEDGLFRQNFGPVNQHKGANRLNVMFTRAKEKMIVFSSVKANDFSWSVNRGVQVLRDFIAYCENFQINETLHQPDRFGAKTIMNWLSENQLEHVVYYPAKDGLVVDGFIDSNTQKILLVDPIIDEEKVDFSNLYHVLKERFNEVKIVLSVDLWQHQDRVKEEVLAYFTK